MMEQKMIARDRSNSTSLTKQAGVAATEFALVAVLFFTLIIAVMEFSRLMYIYSSAVEATRLGARIAVVCSSVDQARVKARMRRILSILKDINIDISYPGECTTSSCEPIKVSIKNVTVDLLMPGLTFTIPSFSTSLPRESLSSANNALCS